MKKIKTIYKALIILIFFSACSEENNLDFLDAIPAPSNVSATYNISQDNTGLVTISPTGESTVEFDVYFGDTTLESVKVKAGQSTSHVYAEGTYNVKVVAYNLKGDTAEITKPLIVSFKAPENLEVVLENDLAVSKQVNVKATADFATMFDFYSGESGVTQPVASGNIGETISYQYQEAGEYDIKVVAKGGAIETTEYIATFEVTEILAPIVSAPTQPNRNESDVISIYSSAYTDVTGTNYFPDWGQGGQGSSWAEFDLNGDKMLQYINLSYQGIALQDGTSVDISTMEFLHMDVWTSGGTTDLETSLINNASGTVTESPVTRSLTAGEWTRIEIPISEYVDQGLTVTEIFQMKFVGTPSAEGTVFIDNIYFYKVPAQTGAPILFDDFEGNGNITTWAGDAAGLNTAFANPFIDANNESATVLEYNDTGGQYANIRFDNASNFDLSGGNSTFKLKIYVPSSSISGSQPNQISLKLQDGTAAEPWALQTEVVKAISLDTWQEITFDFANDVTVGEPDPVNRTDFNRVVIQVNSENNTDTVIAYIDDFSYGNTIVDTPPFATDDFEGNGTITTWAGDSCGMDNMFANPYIDTNNQSATVLEYNDTGGQYANIRFDVSPNFDLTAKAKFTLKIYVPSSSISGSQPNQISLKLQDGTAAEPWALQTEIVKSLALDTWQEITFDFANDVTIGEPDPINRTDFNRVVLQVNSENNNDTVIAYIDDFNYHN
ncbi:hypothetical protein [Tenacibaculum adriaticum]|nr:hypothetical protein [Tenacibaculum adriaticum]